MRKGIEAAERGFIAIRSDLSSHYCQKWNKNRGVQKMRLPCRHLLFIFFHFLLRWTDRPTGRHFDVIFELSLTVSWSMSNFVVIGTSEKMFFVFRK